jgi:signal transduction histidine kinase
MDETANRRAAGGATSLYDHIASPLLRAAARQLASRLEDDPPARQLLEVVSACVDPECARPVDDLTRFDAQESLALLRRLRGEVLRGNPEDHRDSVADLINIAQSFDRVNVWLEAQVAPPESDEEETDVPRMNLAVEIAHDLRSPLTSILFLAQTLRRGESGEINDLQRRQLGLIYAAALGVVSLASNLIELAQGDERLMEQTPAPFSVAEILESICDMERPLAEEKNLALRVLPPAVDYRLGFAAALSRVLLNLLNNALQNTEAGHVEIAVRPKGVNVLEFSVRDTGPGLNQTAQDGLFDPFKRAHAGKRFGFSGTGLGLAICRRLLAAMNSELQYETAPGWGTRFYFDLDLPPATV